jgi:hypothetical protein
MQQHQLHQLQHPSMPSSSVPIFKQIIPDTPAHEKVLSLDRMLNYSGGSALLLYNGKMVAQISGKLILLIDIADAAEAEKLNSNNNISIGFWRLFKKQTLSAASSEGLVQTFLRGHVGPIGMLEVNTSVS